MKLLRVIANLGYGSRSQVQQLFRAGRVRDVDGAVLREDDVVAHARVRLDGAPLDPAAGMVLLLHKPVGYTCSTKGAGRLVYDLLPPRFRIRSPLLSSVGRLDRDTSGLLLFTDDGALLHRMIHPKHKLPKVYEATLARELRGDEGAVFASGKLMLESETTPLAPAQLEVQGPRAARLTITEGRYHQVRRMFAAVGNHVETLHRCAVGGQVLGTLPEGQWRVLAPDEVQAIFVPQGALGASSGPGPGPGPRTRARPGGCAAGAVVAAFTSRCAQAAPWRGQLRQNARFRIRAAPQWRPQVSAAERARFTTFDLGRRHDAAAGPVPRGA